MKWYYWLAIAIALGLVIYLFTKKKTSGSTGSTQLAENASPVSVYNPFEITKIS